MYLKDKAKLLTDLLKDRGAEDGSAVMTLSEMNEVYYEAGKISLMRTVYSESAVVEYIRDKKSGRVSVNQTNEKDLEEAVEKAYSMSLESEPDEFRRSADHSEVKTITSGPMKMDEDKMYERLDEFMEAAAKDYPLLRFDSTSVTHNKMRIIYRNLKGAEITEEKANYSFGAMFTAVDGENSSSFNYFDILSDNLDKPLMEMDDVRRNLEGSSNQTVLIPLEGDGGDDVIIAPSEVRGFLLGAIMTFAGSNAVMTETGKWRDKKGEKVTSDLLTAELNPVGSAGGKTLSDEGYLNENMTVIKEGVLENLVLSDYAARRSGRERSKNHSIWNITVHPGNTSLEDMIKDVKKGILLNRFSGGMPSSSGDFAGIAKNSFYIEDGKITGAATETMVAGNMEDLFNRIESISEETVSDGNGSLPFIRTRGLKISGK